MKDINNKIQTTLISLKQLYLPESVRNLVRKVIHKYFHCFLINLKIIYPTN